MNPSEGVLAITGGRFFSEAVLLELVKAGRARQEAYALVQAAAMKAFQGEGTFQANLAADAEVMGLISAETLAQCFDLRHALRFADTIVDRAIAAE